MLKKGQLLTALNLNNAYLSKLQTASQTVVGPVVFSSGLSISSGLSVSGTVTLSSSLTVSSNLVVNGTGTSSISGNLSVGGSLSFNTLNSSVPWSKLSSAPSSSVGNIDDAVSKRHSQNTDTSTNSSVFTVYNGGSGAGGIQLYSGSGPYLRWTGSEWEIYSNYGTTTLSSVKAGAFKKSDGTEVSYSGHKHTKSDITDFGSYLSLNGGTLTGSLTISKSALYPLVLNSAGVNQGEIGIQFDGCSSDQKGYIIANHLDTASQGAAYSFHIGSNAGSTNVILNGAGNFIAGTNPVWHVGNFDPSTKSDTHSHPYLPLTGGTVEGAITLKKGDGSSNNKGRIYGGVDNNDYIEINGSSDNNVRFVINNVEEAKITSAGLYVADSVYEGGTAISNKYFSKAGGTLSGSLNVNNQIVIDSSTSRTIYGYGTSGNITIKSNSSSSGDVIFNSGATRINKDGRIVFSTPSGSIATSPPIIFSNFSDSDPSLRHNYFRNSHGIVRGLSADLIDGYHAYDIFNSIMGVTDWGVISGCEISTSASPGKLSVSAGLVMVKDLGLVSVSANEFDLPDVGSSSPANPKKYCIFISSNEVNLGATGDFKRGDFCVVSGSNQQEPDLESLGFIDPILLAKVKATSSSPQSADIYPFRKMCSLSLGRTKELKFFAYENLNNPTNDESKYSNKTQLGTQIHSRGALETDGTLKLQGNIIINGLIQTNSNHSSSNLVDLSLDAIKWNTAYSKTHHHFYNQDFVETPNGTRVRFTFTSDAIALLPSQVAVYKNGLRLKPRKVAGDTNCDFWFEKLNESSIYIEFINPPKTGDILMYDYVQEVK